MTLAAGVFDRWLLAFVRCRLPPSLEVETCWRSQITATVGGGVMLAAGVGNVQLLVLPAMWRLPPALADGCGW